MPSMKCTFNKHILIIVTLILNCAQEIKQCYVNIKSSQMASVVKNPSDNSGAARVAGSIPGLERSPGGGNGTPLEDSCLEESTGRGAWWAAKSQT